MTSSASVSSGGTASTTYFGIPLDSYHWQARVIDGNGVTSTWQQFGGSSTSTDFIITTSTYPLYEISDGSVKALFHFDNDLTDSSGKSNNLTNSGTATTTGWLSGAYSFNGSTYASKSSPSSLPLGSNARWYHGWVKYTDKTTNQYFSLAGYGNCSARNLFDVLLPYNSGNDRHLYVSSYADDSENSNAVVPADGVWHMIDVSYNGGLTLTYYVDGVYKGTSSLGSVFDTTSLSSGLIYGENVCTGLGNTFIGLLDDTMFASGEASSGVISTLYSLGGEAVCATTGCESSGNGFPRLDVGALTQYKSDATTTIQQGSSTTESYIVFGAPLQSSATTSVQLQVEVQPAGVSFTGTPNASSSPLLTPGSYATTTFGTSTLVYPREPESWSDDTFHWQARVKDANGTVSPWRLFGANTGSTDFNINTVPLYSQSSSIYPSTSTVDGTGYWHNDTYADGSFTCGGGNTIGFCGCAITTAVMDLRYFGVTTNVSSTDVNPKTLDDWLAGSNGYNSFGDLRWENVPLYAETSLGASTIVFDTTSSIDAASSTLVSSLLNQSTPIPVIVHETNAPDGTSTVADHFGILTGFAHNAGTSTYTIRDSAWYDTKYFNQATTSLDTKINNYSNQYDEIRVFKPVSGGGGDVSLAEPSPYQAKFPLYLEYDTGLPNGIILTDSQWRRSGEDPLSGTKYDEIPGVKYLHEPHSAQLIYSNPPAGNYVINVIGAQTGKYALESYVFDGQHPPVPQKMQGSIQVGSMAIYGQDYTPVNLQVAALSSWGVASSTKNITTIPPHNIISSQPVEPVRSQPPIVSSSTFPSPITSYPIPRLLIPPFVPSTTTISTYPTSSQSDAVN